jgi:hypothetical protein
MTTMAEGRHIAAALMATIVGRDTGDVVIDDAQTLATDTHWIFFYNTRRYVETGSIIHALAGNAPIFVSRSDGHAAIGRTDLPIEEQIAHLPRGKT